MSKLLEKGFTAKEVAQITTLVEEVKAVNVRDATHCRQAMAAWNKIVDILHGRTRDSDDSWDIVTDILGMPLGTCRWTGNTAPIPLLVVIPDGRSSTSYAQADLVATGDWEWLYGENGNIVRAGRLYGDKNILCYSTNPLQYLKFRALPSEKIAYDVKDDACINEEYSGVAPVFLGVELEVERKKDTPKRIEHMVAEDLGMDYVILKSDGSLQDGFEIVTAPATIGFHLQAWDKFFDNSAKHLSSWASGRCGIHVHISRAAFTPMHLGKLITFINNHENRDFVTSIAGRQSSYSKYVEDKHFHVKSKLVSTIVRLTKELNKTKNADTIKALETELAKAKKAMTATNIDITSILQNLEHSGDRYSALNLTKKGTVEVRIFRGNVSKIGFLKNIEFVHAMVEFTRECTFKTSVLTKEEEEERKLKRKENTDYALHYTYFVDWLNKDETGNYNNLKQWLSTHKWNDKYTKKKVSSKCPPNKRTTDDDVRACA